MSSATTRDHATTTIQQVVAPSGAEAATGGSRSIDPLARADLNEQQVASDFEALRVSTRGDVTRGDVTSTIVTAATTEHGTTGHIGAPAASAPGVVLGSGTGDAVIKVRARPYIHSTKAH